MRMGKNDNLAPLKKRTGAVTFFAQDIAGGDSRENVKKLFSLSFSPSAQFLAEKRPPPFLPCGMENGGERLGDRDHLRILEKRALLQRYLPKQWIISSFSDSKNNSTSTVFLSGGKLGEFFLLPLLEFLRSGENPAGGRGEGREKDWSGKERGRMESNLSVKERRGRGGGGGRRHCTHAGPREQNGSKQAKERALFPLFFRARGEEGAAVKWIG